MVRLNEVRTGELRIELPARTDAELYFIGRIHTPWTDRLTCPRQRRAGRTGRPAASQSDRHLYRTAREG